MKVLFYSCYTTVTACFGQPKISQNHNGPRVDIWEKLLPDAQIRILRLSFDSDRVMADLGNTPAALQQGARRVVWSFCCAWGNQIPFLVFTLKFILGSLTLGLYVNGPLQRSKAV